jgi:hypothetical protein
MRFSKNTITQVAGFDGVILAEELLYGVDDYWNITFTTSMEDSTPVDLSGWTFSYRLIRRQVDDIQDVRNKGLELINLQAVPGASEINLDDQIRVVDSSNGIVRMYINDSFFNSVKPVLDSQSPPVYTGYISATLPAIGDSTDNDYIPEQTKKILLLMIVRSDGISAQG